MTTDLEHFTRWLLDRDIHGDVLVSLANVQAQGMAADRKTLTTKQTMKDQENQTKTDRADIPRRALLGYVRVDRCEDPMMWYAGKIGQTFPLSRPPWWSLNKFWTRETAGYLNIVMKTDGIFIEQNSPVLPPNGRDQREFKEGGVG
jgi:hypothetical protein